MLDHILRHAERCQKTWSDGTNLAVKLSGTPEDFCNINQANDLAVEIVKKRRSGREEKEEEKEEERGVAENNMCNHHSVTHLHNSHSTCEDRGVESHHN